MNEWMDGWMDGCFLDQRARKGREGTVRWEVNWILSAGAA